MIRCCLFDKENAITKGSGYVTGTFGGLAFPPLCTKADMVSENKVKLFTVSQ